MKAIRLLFLFSLLLFLSAVLLRQVGLERLAPILLARAGLLQVNLELSQVDHQHLAVRSLAFALPKPDGPIPIRVSDALCRYQASELLQGKISSCSAGKVEIFFPQRKTAKNANRQPDLPKLDKLLQLLDPSRIPLRELELRQLQIHYAAGGPGNPSTFSLKVINEPGRQRLLLCPAESASAPTLQVQLLKKNNTLSATMAADLAGLRGLLPPAAKANLPAQGKLTSQFTSTSSLPLQIQLDLSGLKFSALSIDKMSVFLASEKPFDLREMQLSSASQLAISNLRTGDTRLQSLSLNLAGTLNLTGDRWWWQLSPQKTCILEGLVTGKNRFSPLELEDLNLRTQLSKEQLQLDATLSTPLGKGTITVQCSHQGAPYGTGGCRVASNKPLVLDHGHSPLQLLVDKPAMEIQQGELAFSVESQWQAQTPLRLEADIDLSLRQGAFIDMPLTGLRLRQRLQILPDLQASRKGQLELERLQGPVELKDLKVTTWMQTDSRSKKAVLSLKQGKVDLLDGRLSLQQCPYALDGTPTTCQLSLAAINLEPLIALHQVEGLEVTGRIQGQLPLHFSSKGLRVDRGILENEAQGGVIRYRPPTATLQDSPLTSYALAALSDLHYQQLAAQVDYQPDGTLAVALRIKGSNPGLDNGRPVHLILNTEQNLLSLLKSVQYSRSLSSELGRKLMHAPSP